MDIPSILWIFGGTFAGNVLMSLLGSWYRAIIEVRKSGGSPNRWPVVLAVSLFNAGPWALVAAAIFTCYEISAPWAPWFFSGAFAWIAFPLTLFAIGNRRRARRNESEDSKNAV